MANNRTLTFSFDELPLIVDGAFEDGGVSGEAEIGYWSDGEFSIESISLEVARFKTPAEMEATGLSGRRVRKQHVLDAGSPLYLIIHDRLENTKYWRERVQDAVSEQIHEDAIDAKAFLADQRREMRMGA